MTRRPLLIVTLCLAAAGAQAEPRVLDGVLDPWAPVNPPPLAEWSPPPVALIVNPWGDRVAQSASYPGVVEIVDPWAERPTRPPTARFPAEGVVDPWPIRTVRPPERKANQ